MKTNHWLFLLSVFLISSDLAYSQPVRKENCTKDKASNPKLKLCKQKPKCQLYTSDEGKSWFEKIFDQSKNGECQANSPQGTSGSVFGGWPSFGGNQNGNKNTGTPRSVAGNAAVMGIPAF